ncbi:unnamed protein product [Knipowitschia caucasica]
MGCWLSGPWSDQTVSGRSLTHLSQRDALQILAAAQHPITMQIKSQRRGQKTDHISSWEPLPLGLQHLNLPRSFYSQLPQDCDPRFGFLSSSPRDTLELALQDPELSHAPKEPSCLSCCGPELPESKGFNTQKDEDLVLDKPLGFLHHELDSGLGWTDGSVHQGELSGLETEEVEECRLTGGRTGMGGSPSSESFISSELSDSGFFSVSTGEFRHFQRLLEKRMRLYNARLQNEAYDRSERRDSCPKILLEAIPESLPDQPPCPQHGAEPELPPRGLFRVSSVQFHKSDRPSLNRHSSSSGALFNPAHSVMSRLNAPVLSTCSTPSSHRRTLRPHPPQQHGLKRSRTLHYRPPQPEYRRRASHPASPSYYTLDQSPAPPATMELSHAPPAAAMLELSHTHNDHNMQLQALHYDANANYEANYNARYEANYDANYDANYEANANYEQYWRERREQSRSVPDNNLMMEREIERLREQELKDLELRLQQQEELRLQQQEELRLQQQEELRLQQQEELRIQQQEELRLQQQEELRLQQQEAQRRAQQEAQRESTVRQSIESNRRRFRDNSSSFSQSGEVNDTWPKPNTRNTQSGGSRGHYSTLDGPSGSVAGARPIDRPAGPAAGARGTCGGEGPNRSLGLMTQKAQTNTSPEVKLPQKPTAANRDAGLNREGGSREAGNRVAQTNHEVNLVGNREMNRDSMKRDSVKRVNRDNRVEREAATREALLNQEAANRASAMSRVSRSQLLRHRASQLADERSGMSTDEETGDMLLGRYWSRTERKEHFLLARELRQARGDRSSSRERDRACAAPEDPRASTVLELSHRKLSRLRNRKLLDDWTTVEELLTHGNRLGNHEDALTCPSSLLTVTTV